MGAIGSTARSLAAKSQTNTLRWATLSEVGVFCDAGATRAVLTASERAAESDVRKPEMAARPTTVRW